MEKKTLEKSVNKTNELMQNFCKIFAEHFAELLQNFCRTFAEFLQNFGIFGNFGNFGKFRNLRNIRNQISMLGSVKIM